jgi:hypothetical protein
MLTGEQPEPAALILPGSHLSETDAETVPAG